MIERITIPEPDDAAGQCSAFCPFVVLDEDGFAAFCCQDMHVKSNGYCIPGKSCVPGVYRLVREETQTKGEEQ